MNLSKTRKNKTNSLARHYQAALHLFIEQGTATSLSLSLPLGRQAIALGLEILDLALIHERALMTELLAAGTRAERNRISKCGRNFFAGTVLPLEKIHRSALETNASLSRLNLSLRQRTRDLSASNRNLTREIKRRKTAENSLLESERQSVLLLEQSRLMQEQLRLLSRRVLSAQEEERKRISRELHDVIAQMLTGINVRLALLKTESAINTKGISRKISRTQRLVERSVDIVHRFARELRPAVLDDLGLIPAVRSFLKSFAQETGIRTTLAACAGGTSLNSAKSTALYRVAQESLSNVVRHAQANRVKVTIRRLANTICLQIHDDGKAFDTGKMWHAKKSRHLGMIGMRERMEMVGGTLTVKSAPGLGTTIRAQVPFRHSTRETARS